MKKILLLTFVLTFAVTLKAQHTAPLGITIIHVNVDSLRQEHTDMTEYRQELELIQKGLKADSVNLQKAKLQLKEEQALQKAATRYLKLKDREMSNMLRNYQYNKNALVSLRQECSRQRKDVRDMTMITALTTSVFDTMLTLDTHVFEVNENDTRKVLSSMTELYNTIHEAQLKWSNMQAELSAKSKTISTMEKDLNQTMKKVNSELKALIR